MLAAIAAAAIVVAASLVLGQALLALSGRRAWSPLAAGVGLAALLVVCGIGAKLPGGGKMVAALAGVVVLGAGLWLWRGGLAGQGSSSDKADRGRLREFLSHSERKSRTVATVAALIAAVGASIPFIVNDRVGILGAGLVNDDMANHLLMADWVQNGTQPAPELIDGGYPLGPHSLAAGLADLLGTGLVEAFAGLTIAIAALAAITALAALSNLPPGRRTIAAALAALPYLGAAYLVQGAFKEPLQAILLITFALLLTEATVGRFRRTIGRNRPNVAAALPLAVVAAAAVFNYSFPGLFWLAGAALVWWLARSAHTTIGPSLHALAASLRRAVPGIAATIGVAALLTLPEWPRIADFTGFGAFDPAGEQTGLGNLRQSLNPLEALGVWPTGEFRLAPADAGIRAVAFYLAGLLGAAALAAGIGRAVSLRRDEPAGLALLAALGAAAVIYLGAVIAGTPYTSAKALAIAAPVAMLLALRALLATEAIAVLPLGRRGAGSAPARLAATALALAFVAAATVSTFLVLRQAPVSPPDHADELAEIRPLVEGDPVLFLGRDDFIAWHLRGSPVSTQIQNFFSTGRVPARIDPEDGEKFDFDAVSAATLDRFDWVLTSSTAYASQPPESFELAERTQSYALWERGGETMARELGGTPPAGEGGAPGGRLTCSTLDFDLRQRVSAGIWPMPPAEGPEADWRPSKTVGPGERAAQSLKLEPGIWELSLAYDSPRPLELRVSGPGLGGRDLELPANLDFRGPTPPFPANPTIDLHRRGQYEVEVSLSQAPLAGRLLGGEGEAHLRGLFAVELAEPVETRSGPLPCGEYVDWYRAG